MNLHLYLQEMGSLSSSKLRLRKSALGLPSSIIDEERERERERDKVIEIFQRRTDAGVS